MTAMVCIYFFSVEKGVNQRTDAKAQQRFPDEIRLRFVKPLYFNDFARIRLFDTRAVVGDDGKRQLQPMGQRHRGIQRARGGISKIHSPPNDGIDSLNGKIGQTNIGIEQGAVQI